MPRPEGWESFDEGARLSGALYGANRARMVVFGLKDRGLCVVSPGSDTTDAELAALAGLGEVRFLLAPNHFHNAGLAPWKASYPGAKVVAHERAHARLRKQVPGVEIGGLDLLVPHLPEGVRVFGPPMAKQGETWVSVPVSGGRAWVVCDAVVNESRLAPGLMGLGFRLVGFRAELMTNPLFKRLFLTDRAAYKAWFEEELARDAPTLFVPAHGGVLRGPEVVARLREVTRAA